MNNPSNDQSVGHSHDFARVLNQGLIVPQGFRGRKSFEEASGQAVSNFIGELQFECDIAPGIVHYSHSSGHQLVVARGKEHEIGGKAQSLIDLERDGYRVPPSLIIAPSTFYDVFKPEDLQTESGGLSAGLQDRVEALIDLFPHAPLTVVRSNGRMENLVGGTASGIFSSRFVSQSQSKDHLRASIREVLLSSYCLDAMALYAKHGVGAESLGLVGQVVECDPERFERSAVQSPYLSGIIDSSSPQKIVVGISPGLGTTIASSTGGHLYSLERESDKLVSLGHAGPSEHVQADERLSAQVVERRDVEISSDIVEKAVEKVLLDVSCMEANRAPGLLVEFCFPTREAVEASNPVYLQRSYVDVLDRGFLARTQISIHGGADFRSRIEGQGVLETNDVFYLRMNGEDDSRALDKLRDYNASHGDYLLVAEFEKEGKIFSPHDFFTNIPFHARSKVGAILFVGSMVDLLSEDGEIRSPYWNRTSHLYAFNRSEGILVIYTSFIKDQPMLAKRSECDAFSMSLEAPIRFFADQARGIGIIVPWNA